MSIKKSVLTAFFSTLLILNACGIHESKNPSAESAAITYSADEIGYKEVNELVFQPSCIACHNSAVHQSGIVLDTYAAVKSNLSSAQNAISGGMMPPGAALPADQVNLINEWVSNGSPEVGAAAPSPTATPVASATPHPSATPRPNATPVPSGTPSTLLATYTSVRQAVFVPKCLSCHSAGLSEGRYPMDVYATMMATSGMIVPGNPSSSWVYTEIQAGYMPPSHSSAVTAAELAVIKTWIQNGAPQ